MADDDKKRTPLTTNQKIGIGIAAGVVAIGGAVWWNNKKKDEAAKEAAEKLSAETVSTTTTTTTTETPAPTTAVEAIYSAAPALAIDPGKLPVLRRVQDAPDGKAGTYWVLGDESAKDFALSFGPNVEPSGDPMGGTTTDNGIVSVAGSSSTEPGATKQFIADLGAQIQLKGTEGLPAADAWVAVVGKDQAKYDVEALKSILTKMRAVLAAQPKNQRIIWVLAKSVPGEIAKALGSASEEWYRSRSDNPGDMAVEFRNAVLVRNVAEAQQLFPPPAPVETGPAV